MIVFAAIVPHPPASIPGIGTNDQLEKLQVTIKALERLSLELEKAAPETIVFITPHGVMEEYNFVINKAPLLEGDLSRFGLSGEYSFQNDLSIVNEIIYNCEMNEMPIHGHYDRLDHGTLIPLYHFAQNILPKLVHISFSLLDFPRHFEFGKLLGKVLDGTSKRIAVIASGDLSHRLTPDAPAGYSPSAKYFDKKIVEIIVSQDSHRLLHLKQEVIDEAAECGLRSIIILLSILNGRKYQSQIISYEYPFGIGHLVARLV